MTLKSNLNKYYFFKGLSQKLSLEYSYSRKRIFDFHQQSLEMFLTRSTKLFGYLFIYLFIYLWIFIQDSLFSSQGELLSMRVLRRRS